MERARGCQWMLLCKVFLVDSSQGKGASRGECPCLPMDDSSRFSVVDSSLGKGASLGEGPWLPMDATFQGFPWSILPRAKEPPVESAHVCQWMMLRGFRWSILPWARTPPLERAHGCQWMRSDEFAMVDSSHGRGASRGEGPGPLMDVLSSAFRGRFFP